MTEQEQRTDVGIRLQIFIDTLDLTGKAFAKTLSVAQSHISQICAGKRNLTMHMLYKITRCYPQINVLWLLFGENSMFKSEDQTQMAMEIQAGYWKTRPIALQDLAEIIFSIQEENKDLRNRVEALERKADGTQMKLLP